jgi:hypothetical protein
MTNETGTLKELNVKPGDVVECIDNDGLEWWTIGKHYDVAGWGSPADDDGSKYGSFPDPQPSVMFRIIARASDTPKLWRDMTPEEKGALLLAHHEGKVIGGVSLFVAFFAGLFFVGVLQ